MSLRRVHASLVPLILAAACGSPSADKGTAPLAAEHVASSSQALAGPAEADHQHETKTPIRHVVVIFDENRSFDHYFGTYPHALNPPGEPAFHPRPGTPSINGLS
jgi:phospholipase C